MTPWARICVKSSIDKAFAIYNTMTICHQILSQYHKTLDQNTLFMNPDPPPPNCAQDYLWLLKFFINSGITSDHVPPEKFGKPDSVILFLSIDCCQNPAHQLMAHAAG